ncbi:INO80 chromatin remodeling complex Ies1-like protein [Coniochaeta sp. PMI_546]|nr:INO80 chromatin remodeling complex Ies1-like protein [Coniochaeta sp. PMI_546]
MSDMEQPSSPIQAQASFMTNLTEDEDTKMMDATPDPSEGPRRRRGARDSMAPNGGSTIGKVKHLKKEDGEPLWRKDIQFDFLKAVFDDERKEFTNSYEPETIGKQCFADLYIDTMSRSSKTSKVLRDKLLSDREAAKGMAMVCLLVNIGRMNTTLNFFPEMRAQLRTYHAIPSLQAHQDPHQYKQLQDAPRLKSILKGGAEDRPEPNTLEKIKQCDVPRTNPVNLLFVICQAAPKIAELHFPAGREFHDLVMRTNYTSKSRARAFLWIMWFYLESDFTEEGCEENPFGPGVDYGLDVANQGVPVLEEMTKEEQELENIDTPEEVEFGNAKREMRAKIIEADQQLIADTQAKRPGAAARTRVFPGDELTPVPTSGILPRIRPSKHDSDLDSRTSTPPPRALGARSGPLSNAGTSRRGGASLKYQIVDHSSPAAPGHGIDGIPTRKPRPPTAHQLAVERNRSQRVEYILDRGMRKEHRKARKLRRGEGAIIRALTRLTYMKDREDRPFENSEDEEVAAQNQQRLVLASVGADSTVIPSADPFRERGFGGLTPLASEKDDFGEEASAYAGALRRINRRLARWENHVGPDLGVIRPVKKERINGHKNGDDEDDEDRMDMDDNNTIDPAETEDEQEILLRRAVTHGARRAKTNGSRRRTTNGHTSRVEDELTDGEKELLAEAEGYGGDEAETAEREDQDDDELNDVDKTLLGLDGESDTD